MAQLAHDHGPADIALLEDTIPENLARTVATYGEREALVARHQDIRWTYTEFGERVRQLASGMAGAGLTKGDRVGIWSPNYAEWTLVQFATAELGVILVNINPAYRTHELAYVLRQSGCRWVIAAPTFKTSNYVEMIDAVRDECPDLERAVFFWTPEWEALTGGDEAITEAQLEAIRDSLSPDDPINIQYTSGTTGLPEGRHAHPPQHLEQRLLRGRLQQITHEDRLCIPVPFYHCFGMVMGNLGCTTHGATMVIPGDSFDPTAVLEAVQAERCTSLYGVPTMFIAELGHPDFEPLRPLVAAHRRDGRVALSGRGDEAVRRPHAHERRDHLLRHDRNVAGVSQTLPDDSLHHGTATVGRAPTRRDPDRRPRDGQPCRARPASSAPAATR
jgi:fatty-acyl-CoA synthase